MNEIIQNFLIWIKSTPQERLNPQERALQESIINGKVEIDQLSIVDSNIENSECNGNGEPSQNVSNESFPVDNNCSEKNNYIKVTNKLDEIQKQSVIISEKISKDADEFKQIITNENYKDDMILKLHKDLEQYRNNFYDDIKRPFIKSIIVIHKRMHNRIEHNKEEETNSEDYKSLYMKTLENIKFDYQAILDILDDEYDLRYFEPNIGEMYNSKDENAIQVVKTDNQAQTSMIKDVIYGGFRNIQDGKVFLKANVVVYKYEIKN